MKSVNIAQQILVEARRMPEGSPIRAKAFLHLGSRAAVDPALSRLARRGELLRIARGVYCLPVHGAFGPRCPEPAKVVEGLARAKNATIVESGGTAAHALGLTTQVPVLRSTGRRGGIKSSGSASNAFRCDGRRHGSWRCRTRRPGRPSVRWRRFRARRCLEQSRSCETNFHGRKSNACSVFVLVSRVGLRRR